MIKAVIFDADGMILHGEMFSKRLSKEQNIPYEKIIPFFENEFQKCVIGQADLKEELKKYLNVWNWNKSVEELLEYWFVGEHQIDYRILETIRKIKEKDIKCLLATNQEKYRANYISQKMDFTNIFDELFVSSQVGFKKPETAFFEHILNKLSGIKKNEILFWDDKNHFVEKARQFGFQAELYKNFEDFNEEIDEFLGFNEK